MRRRAEKERRKGRARDRSRVGREGERKRLGRGRQGLDRRKRAVVGEVEVEVEVAVAVVDKQEAQEAQPVVLKGAAEKGAAEKGAAEKGAAEGGLVGRERRARTRSECRAWTLERRAGCEWTE